MPGYQNEVWKPIPGYEGLYDVSDQGRVKRVGKSKGAKVNHIKKLTVKSNGYVVVMLSKSSVKRVRFVHRLVLMAFRKPLPGQTEGNHIDGNPKNNRLSNLEWATRSGNQLHAIHVLKSCSPGSLPGERNHQSKVTGDDVREIRRLYATGKYSYRELAGMFGLTKYPIGAIVRRETWKHVD